MQAVFAVALLVVVAAVVGGVPGMRQLLWQAAACALQIIMQVVTAELCAAHGAMAASMNAGTSQSIARRMTVLRRLPASAAS